MGAKLKSKTQLLNTFFDFWSRFLRVWLQSLKKVLIWPKKYCFLKKSKKVSKNAESHADFESVEKVVKKCTKKSLSKKSLTNMSKSEKVHISFTFLLITFFCSIFSKLFQRIRNQREILRFLIPILNFWRKKNFVALISTFLKLWLQMRRKRLKKTEWMCLRI
jgi:hypothetical protein